MFVKLHYRSAVGNNYKEIQQLLKKQATCTFYCAYYGRLLIEILANSKQLRENEKTLILMDFLR